MRSRNIKGARILLQTATKQGLDNVKNAATKLAEKGIQMITRQGRLPKIVIYDVPRNEIKE